MTIISLFLILLVIFVVAIGAVMVFCEDDYFDGGDRLGAFAATCIMTLLLLCGIEQSSKSHLLETTNLPFIVKEQKDKVNLIADDDRILHVTDYSTIKRIQENKIKIIKQKFNFELSIFGIEHDYVKIIDLETDKELFNERY